MKKIIAAVGLMMLAACGEGSDYALESGTYTITPFTQVAPENDGCGIAAAWADVTQMKVEVADTKVTVFGNVYTTSIPSGELSDGAFSAPRDTEKDWSADLSTAFTCVETRKATFDGTLTADNEISVTYTYTSTTNSGAGCTLDNLGFNPPTCTSKFTFTAKKEAAAQ